MAEAQQAEETPQTEEAVDTDAVNTDTQAQEAPINTASEPRGSITESDVDAARQAYLDSFADGASTEVAKPVKTDGWGQAPAEEKPAEPEPEKADKPAEPETPAEAEKPTEEPEKADEAEPEAELSDDLAAYLPPEVEQPAEPAAAPAPVAEPAESQADAELRAENERMRERMAYMEKQAELVDLDITPPHEYEPSPEELAQELADLAEDKPVLAKTINALLAKGQMTASQASEAAVEAKAPAVAEPVDPAEVQRKQDAALDAALKTDDKMNYWWNYEPEEGKELPPEIKYARKVCVEIDNRLLADPKFKGSAADRIKEVSKIAFQQIKDEVDSKLSKKTEASRPSMAAAPGSAEEDGEIARLKRIPASQLGEEIDKMPRAEQMKVRAAMGLPT